MRSIIRQFALAGGLDEGTDPKQRPPGKLGLLENSVWRKVSRVDKRFGTRALFGPSTNAAKRLFTRGEELCCVDGTSVYALVGSNWINRGRLPEVGLTWSTANDTLAGMKAADVAYVGGYVVHAWVTGDPLDQLTGGDVWIQVAGANGIIVSAPSCIYTGVAAALPSRVRVLTNGVTFFVLFVADGKLKCYSAASGATTDLKTDAVNVIPGRFTYNAFDACVIGSEFVVAYAYTGAPGGIRLVRYSFAAVPVQQATDVVTGAVFPIFSIGIDGAAGAELYIGWCHDTSGLIRFALANPSTMVQTVAPATLSGTVAPINGTVTVHKLPGAGALFATSWDGPIVPTGAIITYACNAAGALSYATYTWSTRLLSRPFTLGSRQYAFAATYTGGNILNAIGTDSFLIDVTSDATTNGQSAREVGKVDALTCGQWFEGHVSNAPVVSATEVLGATPFTGDQGTAQIRQGLRDVRATIGADLPEDMWRATSIGPEAYLCAGVLTAYDGALPVPYGFAQAAFIYPTLTFETNSGGTMVPGAYTYNTVPERRSAAGVLHRGPTAIPWIVTIVTAGYDSAQLALVPVSLAICAQREHVAIYRGLLNNAEILYRRSIDPATAVLVNEAGGSPVLSLADLASDASVGGSSGLSARPPIYTAGGELDDHQPPAFLTVVRHRERLFGLAGDGQTVFVSKDSSSNPGTAPGFHPDVRIYFPEPMVALASMDEKFIGFSAARPWYVLGDGPAPNGEQSDYTNPTPIQTDVGCVNARSLVSMPDGLMFESERGITLLTRGLEVVFVGFDVEDTLAAFPDITSATLVAAQNQVRWTCNAADGLTGRVIVFDYVTKQWSVFRYRDTLGSIADTPIADALMWNGAWTFATPSGKVYVEDATTHLDGGAEWVYARGAIAWLAEGGPLGFVHIRRAFLLADQITPCSIKLSFGFNHVETYAQSYTWDAAALDAIADGANVGMRVGSQNGATPSCRAFRLAWEDGPPPGGPPEPAPNPYPYGTGEGINLSAIGIEFVPKPEMQRRAARARA